MIFTVGHTKGGVGKSTLAWNLAHALLQEGKEVKIIDLDFQQTLSFVNALAKKQRIEVMQPQDANELLELIDNHTGYLIIDTGGFDIDINRLAYSKADKLLVPLGESVTEIIGFKTFEAILGQIDTVSINIILNDIDHRQTNFNDIENAIKSDNIKLLKTIVRHRKTYKTVLKKGNSVFESKNLKAREEILGLKNELIKN